MRAYETIKFTERPDVADIRSEGRKSSVGKLRHGGGRGYCKPVAKRRVRRALKRADKVRASRIWKEME